MCYNFKDKIPTRNSIRQKLRGCYLLLILSRADGDIKLIIIVCYWNLLKVRWHLNREDEWNTRKKCDDFRNSQHRRSYT